ncbi:type IV toxin-antitoxin system AbiEi family antitoxin [Rhodococcus sp. IEGM1428]|uniref:type IV toxin-antitoxin system AbiEi family antitoxin n=1 Tax=Rhodococcus sp. IEGM1428 TaxID=3392191 RepID=UPI003D115F8C
MTTSDVRRRQAGLAPEFAPLPMRTVRAASAADVYAHPRAELSRLTDLGLMHRVATGFFVAVPDDRVGTEWMPGFEAAATGIAVAAYSADDAVVMGVSAVRSHGVIPRALATAVVAVPTRHDPIRLADRQAVVRFVVRDTARLDAERIDTELGAVLVATAEQAVLDLVKRPRLGDVEGCGVACSAAVVQTLRRRCSGGDR